MRRLGIIILITVVATVAVLVLRQRATVAPSTDGKPAFLATTCTPSWRLVPLTTVLDEVSKIAAIPVDRSAISKELGEQPVVLVAIKPTTLGNTLTMLERCAPIRFGVATGGLTVHPVDESASLRLETRRYLASDYGFLAPINIAGPSELLGLLDWKEQSTRRYSLFDHNQRATPEMPDLAAIVEYVRSEVKPGNWEKEGVSIEGRAPTELVFRQTVEGHAAIHAALVKLGRLSAQRKQWQVTFGMQPADVRLATGIVPAMQARELSQRLTDRETIPLSGVLGQRIAGQRVVERSQIYAAEVVAGRLDPLSRVIKHGKSAELYAYEGFETSVVVGQLCWVDEAEPLRIGEIRASPIAGGKKPAEASGAAPIPGERLQVHLPTLWTWRPAGEWCLPRGQALVLCTAHRAGQAVIVIEDVTPGTAPESTKSLSPVTAPPATLTVDLDVRPISDLIDALAKACGTGIQVDAAIVSRWDNRLSASYPNLPWEVVVRQVASEFELDVALQDGFLCVARHEPLRGLERHIYDVRAMNHIPPPHRGVDLTLPDLSQTVLPPIEAVNQPDVSDLVEVLLREVAPTSWSNEGVAIETYGDAIVLTNTQAVHQATAALLTSIERQRTLQIVTRLHPLKTPPADVSEILDATQWAKLAGQTSSPIAVIVARNGQLQNHYAGIKRLVLGEADVNQGFLLPEVHLLTGGLSLQVLATSTFAGVDVEVVLAVSSDTELPAVSITGAGGQQITMLTTPKQTVARSADRRLIPPGGAALYRCGEQIYALTCEVLDPRK